MHIKPQTERNDENDKKLPTNEFDKSDVQWIDVVVQ